MGNNKEVDKQHEKWLEPEDDARSHCEMCGEYSYLFMTHHGDLCGICSDSIEWMDEHFIEEEGW